MTSPPERAPPAASGGDFPFRFRRQPNGASVFFGAPRAIRDPIEPAHADDGEIRLCKRRMRPVAGRLVSCRVNEALVLRARDRIQALARVRPRSARRPANVLDVRKYPPPWRVFRGGNGSGQVQVLDCRVADRIPPINQALLCQGCEAGGRVLYNSRRALRVYPPLRRWDSVHRLRSRSEAARAGAQQRPRREIHSRTTSRPSCLLRSLPVGDSGAQARTSVEALAPYTKRSAHRR